MADLTINQLTEDTAPSTADYLATWDSSAGASKKVSLLNALLLVLNGGADWAFSTWTPSYANLTIGNGTVTNKYTQLGKFVFFYWNFVLGGTSSVGTAPTVSTPVTLASSLTMVMGGGRIADNSPAALYPLSPQVLTTTTVRPMRFTSDSPTQLATLTGSAPITWATSDVIQFWMIGEAA